MISSVRTEELAMAEAHPKVWNLASVIFPLSLSTLSVSLRASPHRMLPTSPVASGFSISPTFLGFRKKSFTFSVYSHMIVSPCVNVDFCGLGLSRLS